MSPQEPLGALSWQEGCAGPKNLAKRVGGVEILKKESNAFKRGFKFSKRVGGVEALKKVTKT